MSMTRKQQAAAAIVKWCRTNGLKPIGPPRHVHPVAYVIGRAAPGCMVVAIPFTDSEPQCAEFNRNNPLQIVRLFASSLRAGDWCSIAYVHREGWSDNVAIPVVTAAKRRRSA